MFPPFDFQPVFLEKLFVAFEHFVTVRQNDPVVAHLVLVVNEPFLENIHDHQRKKQHDERHGHQVIKPRAYAHAQSGHQPYGRGGGGADDAVGITKDNAPTNEADARHDIGGHAGRVAANPDGHHREQRRTQRNQDHRPQPCRLAAVLTLKAHDGSGGEGYQQLYYLLPI